MNALNVASSVDAPAPQPGAFSLFAAGSAPGRRVSVLGQFARSFHSLRNLCLRSLLPPKSRRLRVSETVPLGDKRFVSIVQVDGVDYLIGGGTANVSLLTRLGPAATEPSFQQAVAEAWGPAETA